MAVHSPSRKLTYDDFERIPEDRFRHEILDGVHVVSPAPSRLHQRLLGRLHIELQPFVEAHGLGEVYLAPFDVLLSRHDVVEPDLLFFRTERLGLLTDKRAEGPPDLAVEIVSPGSRRRDMGTKRARYEHLGVGEYWIFDPVAETALVFRRGPAGFRPPQLLATRHDHVLETPLLPGFSVELRRLFRT